MLKKYFCRLLCLLLPLGVITVVTASTGSPYKGREEFRLMGDSTVTLEYGSEYKEPGATAFVVNEKTGKKLEARIHIDGKVDTAKMGSYRICYRMMGSELILYRTVKVVDTTPPVLTLTAGPDTFTLPGNTYQEEGYVATDDYDGDLTAQVQRVETEGTVTYTVTDSSGNVTTAIRDIVYNDPVAPELKLKGEPFMVITMGDSYKEPGYTASDNCDGDITEKVKVSGDLDASWPGSYKLTYTVSDSYGNSVSQTRQVFVKERETDLVNNPLVGDKIIYLTFDDGPGKETPRLLDVLKKYNVPATFFVVNTRYLSTVERAYREGHTIALHSNTHRFENIYASEEAFFADLEKLQTAIEGYTGHKPMLMRFPGGSSNTASKNYNKGIMTRLAQQVTEKGYTYFDWNVDSKDAGGARTEKAVYQNVIRGVQKHTESVVLMHDIKVYTVDAIEEIIVWGLENGYTFRALTADSPTAQHKIRN